MNSTAMQEQPWKILIVDDEPEIHILTKTVLKDVEFEDRRLEFLSAYNGPDTKAVLAEHDNIALILMDVIMEEDDTGLELIRYIREELKNHLTRIILRTGHPGEAPERRIIIEYEINDYKEKVDLTSNKLFTSVIKSLRNYKDLNKLKEIHTDLEESRNNLTDVIEASSALFEMRNLEDFYDELLNQCGLIGSFDGDRFIVDQDTGLLLRASAGRKDLENKVVDFPIPAAAKAGERITLTDRLIACRFAGVPDHGPALIMETENPPNEKTMRKLELFISNAIIVYSNRLLEEETEETLAELVDLLGDVVEERDYEDNELVTHISRVRDFAVYMARKLDYPDEDLIILRNAVPLHDIGKIGIHDNVLTKPGRLDEEEFEHMKGHARIGYEILNSMPRKLPKVAAIIALQHHERWDGKGYPQGLAGEEIHELGRITCIADVFDALTSKRVYRPEAWSVEKTMEFIKVGRGSQFDPKLADLFLEDPEAILEIMTRHRDNPDAIRELPSSHIVKKDMNNG